MKKHVKKILSWMLVLCMMLGSLSLDVFATESDATDQDASTPATMSLTMGTKPADGTTTGNPFVKGTGGSNSFRIPAMVTLNDGTIVAAADARWNTTYDGGGLDTIVSYSKDNGARWNYTFANYLGDNGNEYNGSGSTAFIDPALATDGETVYMLVDLYPYGVALNGSGNTAPSTAVGFNDDGTLKLAANGSSTYNYYLKNGQIYDSSDNVVSGYTVDEYFNITGNGDDTNLFFSDSPYQVVRTGYLYLTKSTDGGKTWSAPTLIPNVKTSSEQVCLVGPGRGLVTGGKIIFPVYSYNNGTQYTSFIYSEDSGATWKRSKNATSSIWSSESAVVELSDGTLRFFFRNGQSSLYYVDYVNDAWENPVDTGIATNSNTQISAIKYSKTVGGKEVIIVSCPTGPDSSGSTNSSANERLNGKIFVGYVNSDKSMSWQREKEVSVTSDNNPFMYSCLTEISNGKVAILYENKESKWGTGDDCYYTMDFQTYDLGLTVDSGEQEDGNDPTVTGEKPITLTVDETITVTDNTGNYEKQMQAEPKKEIATMKVEGKDGQEGGVKYTEASVTCDTLISSDKSNWTAVSGYYYTSDGTNYYPVYAKRSSSWSWSSWSYTYTYTWGYSMTSSTSDVTPIGTQSTTDTSTTSNITVYTQSTTDPVSASTTITFTGVAAGETTAIVGTTQYNITVERKTENITVSVGGTATYADSTGGSGITNTDSTVVKTEYANGQVTFTGLKDGTATVTTAGVIYNVTVNDGTPISIKENETQILLVELEDGQTVTWSSADNSYAGVAGKYDTSAGAYTNEAILAGQNVTDSPVTVTATIKDADGNVVRIEKWIVTVTEGDADSNTTSKYIYINVDTIQNCTVYYSINAGELIKVNGTGILIDEKVSGHYQISFFAAPDEGYALTYMASTNSASEYYVLSNGNPDGSGSDAWPFADGYDYDKNGVSTSGNDSSVYDTSCGFRWALAEGNFTIDQLKVMYSNAIALGCDGALCFTKNNAGTTTDNSSNGNNLHTDLSFVAQKLPKLEKKISTITRSNGTTETYTDGMKVELGDTINYSVVVTRYATNATYGTITYDNEKLTDELTNNNGISSPDMGTSTTSDKTYTYTTSLTLTMDNYAKVVKDGKITNTADFSYSYSSQYSAGSLTSEASAVADITVQMPEYVIDFGLPVSIDLSKVLGDTTISSGTATYGSITKNGKSFTYTPNTTVKDNDHVTLSLANGQSYGVRIIPATTVYYEEGFANVSGFTDGSKGTVSQTASEVGSQEHYGFDAKYAAEQEGASNSTEAVSSAKGNTAEFSFTGTGIDIFANCAKDTGNVLVQLYKADGTLVKMMTIKTVATGAYGDLVSTGAYNSVIASVKGLGYGNYKLKITTTNADPVRLDGFRVYGTLEDEATNAAYASDLEENPTFFNLRDAVLTALNANKGKSSAEIYAQVFEKTEGKINGAVVLSNAELNSADDAETLLNEGPKKEIYLKKGQSLIFKVDTTRKLELGLKAVNDSVTFTVNEKEQTITSDTDMFYEVTKATDGTVTVTNKGDGILAVTNLKICDDPNAAFAELSEDDFTEALINLGIMEKPVSTADANLNISVVDYSGKELASSALTANGEEGEENIFAAADIVEAAKAVLPEGYALVDESAVKDQAIVYGEDGTITVQAGKVATLKVTYKKLFGKTVGTVTLTGVQTSSSTTHTFSAAEIRDAAPDGLWVGTLVSSKVKYGSTATRTVNGL
ncbi:MAG: exo-alpha-sialidase [Lachnospiraceae bacterium]